MSLVNRIMQGMGLATGSSATLQKIKDEAEKRRSAKSSATLPKVAGDVESTVANMLEKRIASQTFEKKKG